MSRGGAYTKSSTSPARGHRRPALRRLANDHPPRQDQALRHRFRVAAYLAQDALRRIDARPCGRAKLARAPFDVHALALHTLLNDVKVWSSPYPGMSPHAALSRALLARLAAHLVEHGQDASPRRCATDPYNTSTRVSLDSRSRSFRREDRLRAELSSFRSKSRREHGAGPPCSNPSPGWRFA